MSPSTRSKLVCHSYYLLFGLVGIGLMPALVRSFEERYALSHSEMGLILGAGAVVMSVSAVFAGAWYDRRGARPPLSACLGLCALGAVGLYLAPNIATFLPLLMLFYLANGLGAVVNPLVARLYDTNRSTGIALLHGLQGAGRMLAPLLVAGSLLLTADWRGVFIAAAGLFGAWFVLVWWGLEGPAAQSSAEPVEAESEEPPLPWFRNPAARLGITAFVFASACESVLMAWLPNCLESEAGFPKAAALASLGVMMAGYTAIRLWVGLRQLTLRPAYAVLSALAIAVGLLAATHVESRAALYAASFVLGVSYGTYWPALAAAVYDRVPRGHGALTGMFNVASTLGGVLFVSLVGLLGDTVGLRLGLLAAPVCAFVFVALYVALTRPPRR